MQIQKLKDVVKGAFAEIKQYQDGKKKIIKSGRPYIDEVGIGLINGGIILVSAGSGVGKSYELSRIQKNVMDVELNPDAGNYVFLSVSLEMRILSLVLRELNKKLDKSMKNILKEEFTEQEKELARNYYESLQDERNYISQSPTGVKQFYEETKKFLEEHRDKDSVFISIDHIVLISSDGGQNKNQVIENLIEKVNELKMHYPNVIFILLSQTNSENIKRAKDKDIMSEPRDLDIYYSQFSFQVADYVCVIANPYRMGIRNYTKINPERYPNLSDYFQEEDSKGRVSLETEGVLYYHLLKCREGGSNYLDKFAERLYTPKEPEVKQISDPVFQSDIKFSEPALPFLNPDDAFGGSDSEDPPF